MDEQKMADRLERINIITSILLICLVITTVTIIILVSSIIDDESKNDSLMFITVSIVSVINLTGGYIIRSFIGTKQRR